MPGNTTVLILCLLSFITLTSFYKPLPMRGLVEKKIRGEVSSPTKGCVNSSFVCFLTRAVHWNRLGSC